MQIANSAGNVHIHVTPGSAEPECSMKHLFANPLDTVFSPLRTPRVEDWLSRSALEETVLTHSVGAPALLVAAALDSRLDSFGIQRCLLAFARGDSATVPKIS